MISPRSIDRLLSGGDAGASRWLAVLAAAVAFLVASATAGNPPAAVNQAAILADTPAQTLSAYRFFADVQGRPEPNVGVTPYDLNTPLWSDGALKLRYVYVPPGAQAQYRDDGVFEFPVGTVLIKTFAYPADMRAPNDDVRLLETRLLIRRSDGWVALPYVWNEEGTDAVYAPIGADLPVSLTWTNGETIAIDWNVPNRNQCKGCHDRGGAITPIGPTARNLNRHYLDESQFEEDFFDTGHVYTINQLFVWEQLGIISDVPGEPPPHPLARVEPNAPRAPNAYDPASGALDERARAYLDVNCAHCHNPEGPAHTSGLDLRWNAGPAIAWGVGKRPTAAGRGSAGMEFAIEPGHPERSFLLHRMESEDPGVMMPELGRTLTDERAVALIREWIAAMNEDGEVR